MPLNSSKESTEYAVVLDPNQPMDDLFAEEVLSPAKEFAFKLDLFQMQAILHLERHSNVLVSAHTSAGKTVIADYAIAMAFRSMSRVIYTSPIKALSNQKYRDFKKEFNDVGLLTGDVQINSDAKCLIMTTEILLQMLYNRSEVVNDLEWVVFDECHYVNDPERGHVWEEVFILLPEKCNLVLLSATVPNVVQFADWLGRARKKKTYVVSTYKRPVPLEHYLYVGRDGKSKHQKFMIVDRDSKFLDDNYKEVEQIMKERKGRLGYIKRCPQTERNIYLNLIRHLEEKDKLPAICFTLSRNRCDSNLENLMAISEDSFQLTTKEEEAKIHRFVGNHLRQLKDCDQKLPQILRTVQMLKRGLGVHHSGILPILKEMTEILFSEGLVKVLVATETFAMGVNMPARTVVFDSIDKHDGNNWRDLKASEYIQMAGRAGRRGKDTTGTVIILCKYDIPDSPRLVCMMMGSPTELVSQFRLTYHMICNFHKTSKSDEKEIENFLERSFGEHNRLKHSSEVTKQLESLKLNIETVSAPECNDCADIEAFYECLEQLMECSKCVNPWVSHRQLKVGRIVAFVAEHNPFESGMILRINKDFLTVLSLNPNNGFIYHNIAFESVLKILNKELKTKTFDPKVIIDENENPKNKHRIKEETMNTIERIKELNLENNYTIVGNECFDTKKMTKQIDLVQSYDNLTKFGQKLLTFKCIKCKDFVKNYNLIKSRMSLIKKKKSLEYELSPRSLQFLAEYQNRIHVLKSLGYLNQHSVLELKGRVACLMSEHELVITEMLMNNIIGDLSPQEIAALLSCFVCQQKSNQNNDQNSNKMIEKKKEELIETALNISTIERECKVSEQLDIDSLKFDLVCVVYEWANGKPFVEVTALTEVQEGIIVRYIQRLDELLKFIKMAAKLMGNNELEEKIELSAQSIRRDIVFCQSLYTIPDFQSKDKEDSDLLDENLNSNFL